MDSENGYPCQDLCVAASKEEQFVQLDRPMLLPEPLGLAREGLEAATISSHLFNQSDATGRNSCNQYSLTFWELHLYRIQHLVGLLIASLKSNLTSVWIWYALAAVVKCVGITFCKCVLLSYYFVYYIQYIKLLQVCQVFISIPQRFTCYSRQCSRTNCQQVCS